MHRLTILHVTIFIQIQSEMLVDSNILIYAVNSDSPKNKRAIAFLKQEKKLVIAHQNILESLRVLTHPKFSRPMTPTDAQISVSAITEACSILLPNEKTHYLAMELINKHHLVGNRIFDAYLAATAMSNGIMKIATDNEKDFKKFGTTVFNPFDSL